MQFSQICSLADKTGEERKIPTYSIFFSNLSKTPEFTKKIADIDGIFFSIDLLTFCSLFFYFIGPHSISE